MKRFAWLALLLSLAGCTQDNKVFRQSNEDLFYQEPSASVDILWVIDNSRSMMQEQKEIALRFQDFINQLNSVDKKIDFHIGVVSTDMSAENPTRAQLLGDPSVITRDTPDFVNVFMQTVMLGTDGDDMERGLDAASTALREPMVSDINAGFLRDEAALSIIFVTDENDCSDRGALPSDADGQDCYKYSSLLVPPEEFVYEFQSLKEESSDVVASAIAGPEMSAGCADSWPGTRYLTVAEATGGIEGDICAKDFTNIMSELGYSVAGVHSSFQLSEIPAVETIEVHVTLEDAKEIFVAEDSVNGWTYDEVNNFLIFNGTSVPPRGSTIRVTYEIAG